MNYLTGLLRSTWADVCEVWSKVRDVPPDAAKVLALAFSMPVFMQVYQLVPGQDFARTAFSLALGALTVLIGWLVEERRSATGYAVQCISIALALGTIGALWTLRIVDHSDATVQTAWRACAGIQQGWMVVAWGVLMRYRHKWLSHSVARAAFVVSILGFAWYLLVNFAPADPLGDSRQWGAILARGVGARTLSGWVEPALALALWAWLILLWRRFLDRPIADDRLG